MNLRNSLFTIALAAGFFAFVASVNAAGTSQCQIIYGGGQVCPEQVKFTIDKKVMQPTKGGAFVDNLSANDAHFAPGTDVAFQITVTNTGNATIENLTVTDTLPANTTFISGAGNFNSDNNTITYTISNLEAGKSNTQTFVARIAGAGNFKEAVTCLTNNVKADNHEGFVATDKAGFCVENVVTSQPQPKIFKEAPPKVIPETGPEMLPLLGLIPAGIAGYFLRKKSNLN